MRGEYESFGVVDWSKGISPWHAKIAQTCREPWLECAIFSEFGCTQFFCVSISCSQDRGRGSGGAFGPGMQLPLCQPLALAWRLQGEVCSVGWRGQFCKW